MMKKIEAFCSSRIVVFLVSCLYVLSLVNLLANYASVEWAIYGYSYSEIEFIDLLILTAILITWALVVPKRIDRPSSLVLIIIYIFVCLPAVVAILGFEKIPTNKYYLLLLVLTLGFSLSCLLTKGFKRYSFDSAREYSKKFIPFLIFLWVISFGVLLYTSASLMNFAGLDSIYEQREIGAAKNLFEGYIQTYFGYVISPALVVIGMHRKNYLYVGLGFIGALVLYLITAEKAVITYPVFIIAFFYILNIKANCYNTAVFIMLLFSLFLFFAVNFYERNEAAAFVAWYLGIRTLLIPGAFIVHYADYFSETGYTYLTHVSGISSFINIPAQYLTDARWPSLGLLVGEDYLNIPTLNANANFMASDGLASYGVVGLFISLMLFAIFLIVLDKATQGIKNSISLPILLPIALTLTNGSLFTVLVSFGGLFWIIVFKLFFQ